MHHPGRSPRRGTDGVLVRPFGKRMIKSMPTYPFLDATRQFATVIAATSDGIARVEDSHDPESDQFLGKIRSV